jgi:hypothetical protein
MSPWIPMLLMLGIVSFLIVLLALEGVLAGNWATISGNIAPIAVVIGVIGVVLVILKK